MSQNQSFGRGGPAPDHVLVTATNVGGNYLQNDTVFAFPISERQLREIDALNFDDARAHISYPAVFCHGLSSGDSVPHLKSFPTRGAAQIATIGPSAHENSVRKENCLPPPLECLRGSESV